MKRYGLYWDGIFVVLLTVFIAAWLAVTTRHITYWPTDSESFYIPAARAIFHLPHLSDIHSLFPAESLGSFALRGKEALILGIAIFQYLLSDFSSLYPNILFLICTNALSSILIFLIAQLFSGRMGGWIAYLVFVTCFWPYIYILYGAHQPLVMMLFLLAIFLLLKSSRYPALIFPAGLCAGGMLYSSPTAVFYFPYFAVPGILGAQSLKRLSTRKTLWMGGLFAAGFLLVISIFTFPDTSGAIQKFCHYLRANQIDNHFVQNFKRLRNILPPPYSHLNDPSLAFRGGGLLWVLIYSIRFLPIILSLYFIASAVIIRYSKNRVRDAGVLVLLGSTPILLELTQVAQAGRHYFSWLPGMIFVIIWGFRCLSEKIERTFIKTSVIWGMRFLLVIHAGWNIQSFLTDILPARMANTKLIYWLKEHRIPKVSVPYNHFGLANTINQLNRTSLGKIVDIEFVSRLTDSKTDYYVLPPLTGKSVWYNCSSEDFYEDPDIYQLAYVKGTLPRYAVAAFPAMSASRFWLQEEEVCTYVDLVRNLITQEDRDRGILYVLDVKEIRGSALNSN